MRTLDKGAYGAFLALVPLDPFSVAAAITLMPLPADTSESAPHLGRWGKQLLLLHQSGPILGNRPAR